MAWAKKRKGILIQKKKSERTSMKSETIGGGKQNLKESQGARGEDQNEDREKRSTRKKRDVPGVIEMPTNRREVGMARLRQKRDEGEEGRRCKKGGRGGGSLKTKKKKKVRHYPTFTN